MLPVHGGLVDPRLELVGLVGLVGQRQRAGLLEVAVDAVLARERDETGQVVDALAFERFQLVGEVADAVGQAVRQAGLAEAAVPPTGAESDGLRLEDRDAQRRVGIGQRDRGPQAREPGPHDGDVHIEPFASQERRVGDPGRGRVAKPVGDGDVGRVGHEGHRGTLGDDRGGGLRCARRGGPRRSRP